jgi:metal-responsive CopG/Arc/MetJ family transcriptional regulator
MARTTISMPEDLLERIDAELTGTDTRSGWIRKAAKEQLNRENAESSGSRPEETGASA